MAGKRTFWNSSRGRHETTLRADVKRSPEHEITDSSVQLALSVAILADQLIAAQPATMFGDTKFAFHLKAALAEYGRALDRALLTPQSRLTIRDADALPNPFADVTDNVRSILKD